MHQLRRHAKFIVPVILLGLSATSIPIPAAHAGLINTETVIDADRAQQNREHVRGVLHRGDIKAYLEARGVDPTEAQARADSLTDAELQALAGRLEGLPAGAGLLEVALIAFIVLVITDALGYTDIFPFVKSSKKK